jgi:hypothetical protein
MNLMRTLIILIGLSILIIIGLISYYRYKITKYEIYEYENNMTQRDVYHNLRDLNGSTNDLFDLSLSNFKDTGENNEK